MLLHWLRISLVPSCQVFWPSSALTFAHRASIYSTTFSISDTIAPILASDYAHSLQDIEQVLIREPRHFGALAGLGMIMQDIGDEKRALDAFRKALAINPHLEKVPDLVKTLTEKVEGRDI